MLFSIKIIDGWALTHTRAPTHAHPDHRSSCCPGPFHLVPQSTVPTPPISLLVALMCSVNAILENMATMEPDRAGSQAPHCPDSSQNASGTGAADTQVAKLADTVFLLSCGALAAGA